MSSISAQLHAYSRGLTVIRFSNGQILNTTCSMNRFISALDAYKIKENVQ